MNINALQDFISVVTHGGFGAAGRATTTPKATLSRRVRQLEDELKIRLFERSNMGFVLTVEGSLLFERVFPLLKELDEVKSHMMDYSAIPSGKLRISVPPVTIHKNLGVLAAEYKQRHPLVELELVASDKKVNPVLEGFDAVIRSNPDSDESMSGVNFFTEKLLLVAPLSYQKYSIEKISEVPLPLVSIGARWQPQSIETSLNGSARSFKVNTVMYLSSPFMILSAVVAGAGVALLPHGLVSEYVEDGRLISLGFSSELDLKLWCLYPSRRHMSASLRAFIELLKEMFPLTGVETLK
jgi:DNA-binding transcriptional LysR family regulator